MNDTRIVDIYIRTHKKTRLLMAFTKDSTGLNVAARDYETLDQEIMAALRAIYEARGLRVSDVKMLDADDVAADDFVPMHLRAETKLMAA
jgi:hypothetical protein